MSNFKLIVGECGGAMRAMADGSVDAVVTDPPYGLRFMGKRWDYEVPSVDTFAEMLRVLKDGGRLLCFAGTRTFHRMWCNIEDAGFTIEDTIAWMYGSGFPKHRSKLKPAFEPICVARKGGVSELNIDACRIGTDERTYAMSGAPGGNGQRLIGGDGRDVENARRYAERSKALPPVTVSGRWPANVVLDEEAARVLDEMSGSLSSHDGRPFRRTSADKSVNVYGAFEDRRGDVGYYGDIGGASRFYYTAKASRSEREQGLEGLSKRNGAENYGTIQDNRPHMPEGYKYETRVANHHPTVKPVDLMCWLVRLITKPGDLVLDPFCGSGTTGIAALEEQRRFVGIDIDADYIEITRRRCDGRQVVLFPD